METSRFKVTDYLYICLSGLSALEPVPVSVPRNVDGKEWARLRIRFRYRQVCLARGTSVGRRTSVTPGRGGACAMRPGRSGRGTPPDGKATGAGFFRASFEPDCAACIVVNL